MKTILCYGDSNTWGCKPFSEERFGLDERWPGVLRNTLGKDYWVIEEGLNGRTTVWDDPVMDGRSGKVYLGPCLQTHKPVDLVVMMLGSNDLKPKFSVSAYEIARSVKTLVDIIQKSDTGPGAEAPQVLVISPPHVVALEEEGEWKEQFMGAAKKSQQFAKYYAEVAQLTGCHFLDAAEVIVSSSRDGIHLEASEHKKLGEAVAAKVREIFELVD